MELTLKAILNAVDTIPAGDEFFKYWKDLRNSVDWDTFTKFYRNEIPEATKLEIVDKLRGATLI